MNETKKALVVGAGVAGLATAIHLAKQGFEVTVYEKNAAPGGRCGQIQREGHRFDLGATIYLMPSIYRSTFASMGLDVDQCFESKPMETIYKLFFDDGEIIDFTTNKAQLKAQVERLEPGSYDNLMAYVTTGYRLFQLSMRRLLGRNFYHLFQFVRFKNIGLVFAIKTHLGHIRYIQRFVKHPHLQKAFTFQNIYVGQNPYTAPALFSMLPAAELTEGSLVPIGGMYRIVASLLMVCESLGVTIHCSSPVKQVLISTRHKVDGVLLEDGRTDFGDVVVANADLPYVYANLLPKSLATKWHKHLQYSCSALVFHWALDKRYPQLSHHNVFLSEPYRDGFKKIFTDKSLSTTPCFYIHAPVGLDPSAAPEGEDTLSILVPVGHLDPSKAQDWEAITAMARKHVLNRLKQQGLEDIEAHIKFELTGNPATWYETLHVARGAIFGSVSHSIFQMGYFRPHNRHATYKNLYFAGGSTHPGNGVPLVLLSAQLTGERIAHDFSTHRQ